MMDEEGEDELEDLDKQSKDVCDGEESEPNAGAV